MPLIICALPPLKVTVPVLGVNVPPLFVQLPDTLIGLPLLASVAPLSICTLLKVLLLVKVPACTRSKPVTVNVLPPALTPEPPPVLFDVRLVKLVVPKSC